MKAFQLDGYLGVSPDDPRSLEAWLRRSVVTPWGLQPEQVVRLPEDGRDPEGACREYEAAVRAAGGFDIVVLGLGPNGHLGYNEPPSPADAPTRVVTLRPESAASATAYFGDAAIPQRGMTAGMDVLLAAKHILLMVSGAAKRDILQATLHGPVTPDVPSSFLQGMPNVTVIADRDAAGNGGTA
jgi:glucosamine-6-phosphate deaminase